MKRNTWVMVGILFGLFGFAMHADELEKGKVVPTVTCAGQTEQSYALYLPTSYNPGQSWPILYGLDAGARGVIPVELFKDAAEKYGYILVGSNNSKNGPIKNAATAVRSIWRDTHARFKIDPRRIYTAGMSGAGQVALFFSEIVGLNVTGVVDNSSGLLSIQPVEKFPKTTAVFLVAGNSDFNYQVTRGLAEAFSRNEVVHTFVDFSGGHRWMPQELATEAVEWFELQAMKTGAKAKDDALLDAILTKRRNQLLEMEKSGSVWEVVSTGERLLRDFANLRDLPEILEKVAILTGGKAYQLAKREEEECQKTELVREGNIFGLLASYQRNEDEVDRFKLVSVMGIPALLKEAKSEKPLVAESATRLLIGFSQRASSLAWEGEEREDFSLALALYDLASRFTPNRLAPWVNIARMQSKKGSEKLALVALNKAVECGFSNLDFIQNDVDLQRLKDNQKFKELLLSIKVKAEKPQ